jgi:hypothetical protein
MKRIRELIETVTRVYPQDRFFLGFEESCRTNAAKRAAYRTYDDALQVLDGRSWQILKDKAVAHFRDHRRGQLKQGFFNQLNEAFAYRFLVRQGCTGVVMLPERGASTPDIQYVEAGRVKHCEVKTLGLSDEEIHRRASRKVFTNAYIELGEGFFRKLASSVGIAEAQIATQGTSGLVYLLIIWDDMALDYYPEYRRQVVSFCRDQNMRDVYVKVGLRGNRRMRITTPCS